MWVDSHCHFHLLPNFPAEFDACRKAAESAQVETFLNVATDLHEHDTLCQLAQQPRIFISAGLHPNEQPGQPLDMAKLAQQLAHPKVIAIGETGLDYYRQTEAAEDFSWQQQRFAQHIALAKQFSKPLIIHMRQASQDTLALLRSEGGGEIGGVMHCFTENWEVTKKALDLGFYISFSGIVSFKKATALHEVAKKVPSDRYVVETDCPYLAPEPFRGKTNQPAYIPQVGAAVAHWREVSTEQVAEESTHNFYTLFGQGLRP